MSEETGKQAPQIELHMIVNPRELSQSVGEWSDRQPWKGREDPILGVAEELGELCHGVLKHHQGIRGFDNVDKYHAHCKDALGDIMVYLSHYCYMQKTFYNRMIPEDVIVEPIDTIRARIGSAMVSVGRILLWSYTPTPDVVQAVLSSIVRDLQIIAKMFGWDLFADCLYLTWHKVRQRDWNKDKMLGGSTEIEAASQQQQGHGDGLTRVERFGSHARELPGNAGVNRGDAD